MTITIRTAGDASSVIRAATAVIREQDPNLAVSDMRTMDDVVANSVAQRRLTVQVIGMFALVALVLAAVGIYGVIAYMVTQRTQEIGIRMALGAQRGRVLRMIVAEAMTLDGAGASSARRRAAPDAADEGSALRGAAERSADARGRRDRVDARRAGGQLPAGPPGHESRSGRCAQGRVRIVLSFFSAPGDSVR